jgi:2-haloacid dehalogenase
MKYDILIFDADETLFDFKKSEREAFYNALLELKIETPEVHYPIYQTINTAIWKEFEQGLINQQDLKIERFKRLVDHLHLNLKPEAIAKSYMKHLREASFLFEDSFVLIQELSKDYELYMITNGLKDVQENRICKSIIAPYFQSIVISEVVGVSKPNPKIFELTFHHMNDLDKRKVLMIGDSLTSDIQGGINYGIDTCWYNPHKKVNQTEIQPTYEITSLLEIKHVLTKNY